MDDLPPEPANLRFLRILVTVLTATMILGIATIVVLLFMRFSSETQAPEALLPDQITLPDGVAATAVTVGKGWYLVVTTDDEILIFDRDTGQVRQRVAIAP